MAIKRGAKIASINIIDNTEKRTTKKLKHGTRKQEKKQKGLIQKNTKETTEVIN